MYSGVLKFAAILESMAPGVLNREHRVATSACIVRLPLCLWRTDFGVARDARTRDAIQRTSFPVHSAPHRPAGRVTKSRSSQLDQAKPHMGRAESPASQDRVQPLRRRCSARRSTTRFLRFRSGCGPAANRLTSARVPSTTKTPQSYSFLCWLMGASCRLAPTRSAIVAASLSLYPNILELSHSDRQPAGLERGDPPAETTNGSHGD
ncbi:hypothetical protein ACVIGB_008242 [Bradyrhizobium sp. USDA 4341]